MTAVLPAALQLAPREFLQSSEATRSEFSQAKAEAYTKWLATHHYENFHVVSFLLPKRLHQDFFNVYAYCRWADDLGDEIGDQQESLRLLAWWGGELKRMYEGSATHPVFVALRDTVEKHAIPQKPFADLIHAFLQDQQIARYETWDAVLDYCVYSANPVGRLVLYLGGYSDAERQRLSDATCTALQLANFWQDVTVDLRKDRLYIPLEVLHRNQVTVDDVFARRFSAGFRTAMEECVARAQLLFQKGLPLAGTVDRALALDLDLFSRGGMRVLAKIRNRNFDVLTERPSISKLERVGILVGALRRLAVRRAA